MQNIQSSDLLDIYKRVDLLRAKYPKEVSGEITAFGWCFHGNERQGWAGTTSDGRLVTTNSTTINSQSIDSTKYKNISISYRVNGFSHANKNYVFKDLLKVDMMLLLYDIDGVNIYSIGLPIKQTFLPQVFIHTFPNTLQKNIARIDFVINASMNGVAGYINTLFEVEYIKLDKESIFSKYSADKIIDAEDINTARANIEKLLDTNIDWNNPGDGDELEVPFKDSPATMDLRQLRSPLDNLSGFDGATKLDDKWGALNGCKESDKRTCGCDARAHGFVRCTCDTDREAMCKCDGGTCYSQSISCHCNGSVLYFGNNADGTEIKDYINPLDGAVIKNHNGTVLTKPSIEAKATIQEASPMIFIDETKWYASDDSYDESLYQRLDALYNAPPGYYLSNVTTQINPRDTSLRSYGNSDANSGVWVEALPFGDYLHYERKQASLDPILGFLETPVAATFSPNDKVTGISATAFWHVTRPKGTSCYIRGISRRDQKEAKSVKGLTIDYGEPRKVSQFSVSYNASIDHYAVIYGTNDPSGTAWVDLSRDHSMFNASSTGLDFDLIPNPAAPSYPCSAVTIRNNSLNGKPIFKDKDTFTLSGTIPRGHYAGTYRLESIDPVNRPNQFYMKFLDGDGTWWPHRVWTINSGYTFSLDTCTITRTDDSILTESTYLKSTQASATINIINQGYYQYYKIAFFTKDMGSGHYIDIIGLSNTLAVDEIQKITCGDMAAPLPITCLCNMTKYQVRNTPKGAIVQLNRLNDFDYPLDNTVNLYFHGPICFVNNYIVFIEYRERELNESNHNRTYNFDIKVYDIINDKTSVLYESGSIYYYADGAEIFYKVDSTGIKILIIRDTESYITSDNGNSGHSIHGSEGRVITIPILSSGFGTATFSSFTSKYDDSGYFPVIDGILTQQKVYYVNRTPNINNNYAIAIDYNTADAKTKRKRDEVKSHSYNETYRGAFELFIKRKANCPLHTRDSYDSSWHIEDWWDKCVLYKKIYTSPTMYKEYYGLICNIENYRVKGEDAKRLLNILWVSGEES